MKYLVLVCFIILFTGCSAKCIQNEYDCNDVERGVVGTMNVVSKIVELAKPAIDAAIDAKGFKK